jgi:hypothetical protein
MLRWLLDNRLLHLYGNKKQYGTAPKYNLWLPQPDEAYEFWDAYSGEQFSRDALHDRSCESGACRALRTAAGRVVASQRRRRFSAKLTGPPRMRFLNSVFPDARFVHVIRDGRAVVHSLLNVPFWREKGGFERPFWTGLLRPIEASAWESANRDPGVLAGLQWKRVVELARTEAAEIDPGRYTEIRYEHFAASPHEALDAVVRSCGLPEASEVHRAIDAGPGVLDMNAKFRHDLPTDTLAVLTASMQPLLGELGYG